MRLSLFFNLDGLPDVPPTTLYRDVEEIAVAADALGFATVWVAEHHFALYGRLPNPLLFLARLSAVTRNIGLGTAVVEAPHYHPIRLAEDAVLLDALSGGRLHLGVGSGAGNKPAEFAAFGTAMEEKGERLREMVAALDDAFRTGTLDYAGSYHPPHGHPGLLLDPPATRPARDFLYVAASASTPEWAGAGGYRLLVPRVGSASDHAERVRQYRAKVCGAGYVAQLRFVFVAETEAEARQQTRQAFARYARYDCGVDWDGRSDTDQYTALMERMNMAIGTPETVVARMRQWQAETAPDELICQTYAAGIERADALNSMRLLAERVLTELQETA